MLSRTFFIVTALCSASVLGLVGCAADADGTDADEASASAEADLTAAGKLLIGSYTADFGSFRNLVLTGKTVGQANEFTAQVNTGVLCVTAPCPSQETIRGTFTAGTKTITLRSPTASQLVQHLLGKYDYVVRGETLALSRGAFSQSLAKVENACTGLAREACSANKACHAVFGPSSCSPDGKICTKDFAFKGCEAAEVVDECAGLGREACDANDACQPVFGPSACSPDGKICTADFAFKGCKKGAVTCMSSATCGAGEHCSTDDGVCNSSGLLQVCVGNCTK